MSEEHRTVHVAPAPGTQKAKRFRPGLRYELLGCGLHGHELIGLGARHLRPQDSLFARQDPSGFRWYRCLRCDSWLALANPVRPNADTPPEHDQIELPLRGRPLRDRYVLRLIACERAVHVLVLGVLAAAVLLFAAHRSLLHHEYTKVLSDLQGGLGGPVFGPHSHVVSDLNHLFSLSELQLYLAGAALGAYTAVLALEMVGLWYARRWAEYLTLVETGVLVPVEVYEVVGTATPLKLTTLVINLAVVAYLLFAHRLFGLRGGVAAERAKHARDTGWQALERATPPGIYSPGGTGGQDGTGGPDGTGGQDDTADRDRSAPGAAGPALGQGAALA